MTNVVISGYAALASTGNDLEAIWTAVQQGQSGIRPIESWDTDGWAYTRGAELYAYQPRQLLRDRKLLKALSRQDVIGLAAVEQALVQSRLLADRDACDDPVRFNDRTGVFVGSPGNKFRQQYDFVPLLHQAERDWAQFGKQLSSSVHPMWLLRTLPNNVLAYTGIQYGFKGPNQNITNHGVGGMQAIHEAVSHIQLGVIDRAIVVAYDSAAEPQGMQHYAALGLLSATDLKPFAQDRDGTILGEAGAVMILESKASASQRNATIYGEILAGHSSTECAGIFGIDASGASLRTHLMHVMAKAGLTAEAIGMVVAHGNGNRISDSADARALQAFTPYQTPMTGFKWSTGHTVTTAGVLEPLISLLALREKQCPGIANLDRLAPEFASLTISHATQPIQQNTALICCRGFGSLNASLIISGC